MIVKTAKHAAPAKPAVRLMPLAVFALLVVLGQTARAQWATNGNDINTTNTGKVGIGTTAPATKLDVAGTTKSDSFSVGGAAAEKSFVVVWNNGVANQKVQVYWPASTQVDGIYEITVTGHYWYSNSNGGIRKRIVINGRNIGIINMQQSEVPFRLGFTGNSFTVSDIMWDSANSRYYFIVSNLDNAQNGMNIHVKSITPVQMTSNADSLTVSPIYTTDATVYPQLQTSIMGSNVGIGTNTPGFKLDVQGGQINASGGLCIAGDCKTAWSQVGGAGQWTTSGTNVYYNSGNVGVGTTAPGARLDVGAGAAARGSYTDLLIGSGGNNAQLEFYGPTKSAAVAHDEAMGGLVFYTNGPSFAPNFFIGNSGNVGVGTTAPAARLHVAGGGRFDGTTGRVYLGTGAVAGGRGLEIIEENATTFSIRHHDPNVAWQNIAINPYGGNVGVGTATPRGKLEVAGGSLFLGDMGNAGWGNVVVRGRVFSSSNNIHLSPPGGTGVYINSDYRDAGGTTGPVTLNVSGNITGAGFCIGTDCKTAWSQVGGGTSQWTTTGSNVYFNTGNVGIGLTNPAYPLSVRSSGSFAPLNLQGGSGTVEIWKDTTPTRAVAFGSAVPGTPAGDDAQISTYNGAIWLSRLTVQMSSGNVGIGTTAPNSAKLVVAGSAGAPGIDLATSDMYAEMRVIRNSINAGDKDLYLQFQAGVNSKTHIYSNNAETITVSGGKVGVGKTNPTEALDVVGNINVSGNINAKYQDLAEWVPSSQKLAAGTVVVLDPERANHVLASTTAYDTAVAGVISLQPGITLGEAGDGKALVATTGRVRVKVDATSAPIHIGDLLVTSGTSGVAMKSEPVIVGGRKMHAPGTIIGKALETLESGTGEILVLLSLQ